MADAAVVTGATGGIAAVTTKWYARSNPR